MNGDRRIYRPSARTMHAMTRDAIYDNDITSRPPP